MQANVMQAFDRVGVVGSEFRENLARDIAKSVVLRNGADVVRLSGPTGSGKDSAVKAIHEVARDTLGRGGDLVRFDCANLEPQLFESTLFGHLKGAYPGASRASAGLVDKAKGGTLVLDQVENLSPDLQSRLLSLLGERSYRALGSKSQKRTDALIVLTTGEAPQGLVKSGVLRRDILDRAPAKVELRPLYERRQDIRDLVHHFAREAAREVGVSRFEGFTRRASEDIEKAVVSAGEGSVRRLRELIRDVVFDMTAAGLLPEGEPISSEAVLGYLNAEFGYDSSSREELDAQELDESFGVEVEQELLLQLAKAHNISAESLMKLCEVLSEIITTPDGRPKCYRNIVERSNLMMKVSFWLVSKAKTQSEFRRFFGSQSFEMPAKSVAWQIFNEVFQRSDA